MLSTINNAHPTLADSLADPVIADDASGRQLEDSRVDTTLPKLYAC